METHRRKLEKTCRTCRKSIIVNKHYRTPKTVVQNSKQILALFNYEISDDCDNVHPAFLCKECVGKLSRVNTVNHLHEIVDIAPFYEHIDDGCFCQPYFKTIPHEFSVKAKIEFNNNKIENIANNFGLIKTTSSGNELIVVRKILEEAVSIMITIKILPNFMWHLFVFDREVPKNCNGFFSNLPRVLNENNTTAFFQALSTSRVCPGNEDFKELIQQKLGDGTTKLTLRNGAVRGIIENNRLTEIKGTTIRNVGCELLLCVSDNSDRCTACSNHRKTLRIMNTRVKIQQSPVKMNRPISSMSKKQLKRRLSDVTREKRDLVRKKKELEKRMERIVAKEGVSLDKSAHDLVTDILKKEEPTFDKDSVLHLLWEQQTKSNNYKKQSSMRWHPVLIRWCLSIYLRSPGTYDHIRKTGFLQLPHRTTLNQYTNFTDIGTGYNPDVIRRLYDDKKFTDMHPNHRICSLLFDEMKIKSGLVFNSKTGKLIGFTELGEIGNELQEFEKNVSNNECKSPPLATHVLTVMARGIVSHFNYPIGFFATTTADADKLFCILWEGVRVMEMTGMRVCAFICDGASQNRRFFLLQKLSDGKNVSPDGVVYWCWNRFDSTRKIYFFSDPPHLMKTLRNNIEKSNGTTGTRNLMIEGKEVSWQHIRNVYEWDLNLKSFAPGLRKLHKVTNEHVYLTPRLRMRVNLAVQVLSSSMADGLKSQGHETTKVTENLIRMLDQFFDCFNVSTTYQGQKARKEALYPYRELNDWRFQWLEHVFLKYLNDWKKETLTIPNTNKQDQAKRCLSYQTLEGIRMTVRSFVELIPELLRKDGIEYVLSEKLNQDPLEEHFGKQRMRGGANDNPSLEQYMYNERKIIVAKSDMITSMRGNTRGRLREKVTIDIHDESTLPKRKKKKSTLKLDSSPKKKKKE